MTKTGLIAYSIALFFGFSYIPNHSFCQNIISAPARFLVDQLEEYYNPDTGLWETTSWWNAANVLAALIQYENLTNDNSNRWIIDHTFQKTKRFEVQATEGKKAWTCENYINDYYDDEGWWALAWLDAFELTEDKKYLDMARVIFRDITNGWDEKCNGGIYWKKGLSYKSSISNELAMTLAARLHIHFPETVAKRTYEKWAKDIWEWINSSQLTNPQGQIRDGIRDDCSISQNVWTYNQGVLLSGLVYLHKITSYDAYQGYAHSIAEAAIKNMTDESGILVEMLCEPDRCNGDQDQFKGIFMRHLAALHKYDQRILYQDFMLRNATFIWEKAMQNGSLAPGVSWNGTTEKSSAATCSSALDAINAALLINK